MGYPNITKPEPIKEMSDKRLNAERVFLTGYLRHLQYEEPSFKKHAKMYDDVMSEVERRRAKEIEVRKSKFRFGGIR